MEDQYLHEPLTRKQQILDVDKYVDFYLDYLGWQEGANDLTWRIPVSFIEYHPEGVQYL